MSALLEIGETQSQGLESPPWLPGLTSGLKKSKNQPQITIYSDQEPYDNIKTEGTSPSYPKEALPLERFNGEILSIRADVATVKTDVAELKTDVAVLKTEVKHIAENTQKVPGLVTDVAVIKTEINHIRRSLDKITGIFISIFVTIVGGILVWYFTPR